MEVGSLVAERYMLLKKEGHGGTADIFRAFDQKLDRTVALKLFRQGSIADGVLIEIWNRESKALSRLRHRNIVGFYDAGRCETNGIRFIALEWFDGVTLAEELNKHSGMEYREFHARYGEAILSALTYAAEQSIIHRDISPGNILV